MKPYELTDGVVLLSAPTALDAQRITDLCQEPSIPRWTTMPSPYTLSDAEHFLDRIVAVGWAEGSEITWAIRQLPTRTLIGMVGVSGLQLTPELGFWMGAQYRGQGLTTRAARLAATAAFERHGVDLVRWSAIKGNEASLRIAWKLGFRILDEDRVIEQRGLRLSGWSATLHRGEPMRPRAPWPTSPA